MKSTALFAAAPIALVLVFASAALAQPPEAGAGGRGEWRRMHHQEVMTDLHTVLRIRPEQEGAFQAFAATAGPRARDGRDRGDEAGVDALTTPQLIDRLNASKAAHDAEDRQHGMAVKRFYAALSPEQQQVFDALRRLTMGHGGWGGRARGPRGGPGGRGPGGPPPG